MRVQPNGTPQSSPPNELAPEGNPKPPTFSTTSQAPFSQKVLPQLFDASKPVSRQEMNNALVAGKVLFFDEQLFNNGKEGLDLRITKQWATWCDRVHKEIEKRYSSLQDGEGLFLTLCHPAAYGTATHISAIVIGKTAQGPCVKMMHHESIHLPITKESSSFDHNTGRMNALGLVLDSYDSRAAHRAVLGNDLPFKEIAVIRSLHHGGFPSVTFRQISNFQAAHEHIVRCTAMTQAALASGDLEPFTYAGYEGKNPGSAVRKPPYPTRMAKTADQALLNNCLLHTLELYLASEAPASQPPNAARLELIGNLMTTYGLLADTAALPENKLPPPGPKAFREYGVRLAIDTQQALHAPVPSGFTEVLQKTGLSLEQYQTAMRFLEFLQTQIGPSRAKPLPSDFIKALQKIEQQYCLEQYHQKDMRSLALVSLQIQIDRADQTNPNRSKL